METKSTVLVQQLCLIEQRLHRDIPKMELSDLGWTKRKKGNEATAVMAIIARFNEFSRWVAYEILKGPTADQRAKIIEKFIRICDVSSPPFLSLSNDFIVFNDLPPLIRN